MGKAAFLSIFLRESRFIQKSPEHTYFCFLNMLNRLCFGISSVAPAKMLGHEWYQTDGPNGRRQLNVDRSRAWFKGSMLRVRGNSNSKCFLRAGNLRLWVSFHD